MKLSKNILLVLCDIYEIGVGYYELQYPRDKDVIVGDKDFCQHDKLMKESVYYSRQIVAVQYYELVSFEYYHNNGWRVFRRRE